MNPLKLNHHHYLLTLVISNLYGFWGTQKEESFHNLPVWCFPCIYIEWFSWFFDSV